VHGTLTISLSTLPPVLKPRAPKADPNIVPLSRIDLSNVLANELCSKKNFSKISSGFPPNLYPPFSYPSAK
jgi:hypothetical protein